MAAHQAGLVPVLHDNRIRRRRGAIEGDSDQLLLGQPAILGASGDFLPDIAALVEVDAVQGLEAVFQQQRLLHFKVAAAIRHAKADAQGIVVVQRRGDAARRRQACNTGRGQERPHTQARVARINEGHAAIPCPRRAGFAIQAKIGGSTFPPGQHDSVIGICVGKRHLGAQPVQCQPPGQVGLALALAIQQQAAVQVGNAEVMQVAALRR